MKKLALLLVTVLLTACQNAPNKIIIQPNYTYPSSNAFIDNMALTVQDIRQNATALRVIETDKTVKIPSNNLEQALAKTLSNALTNNGVNLDPYAATQMQIDIHQLEVIVQQQTFKYRSEGIVELEVKISQGNRNFSKYYNGNQNSEGPLFHDKAKIESQINTLLEQLINRIVNDNELHEFIKS